MPIAEGTRLGPYEVVSLLGVGGMGEVYRARDGRLGRDVAVKVLPASVAEQPERLRRFEQEAQAEGLLNHPNVVIVHDVGTHDGTPYLVTELLEGQSLRRRLEKGPLPLREAVDVALQIARGLAAAHEKGIVHRDLKPDNVFLIARRRREDPRLRRSQAPRAGVAHRLAQRGGTRRPQRRRDAGPDRWHRLRDPGRHAGIHVPGAGLRRRRSTSAATSSPSALCCTRC